MDDYVSREAAIAEVQKAADCANCNGRGNNICGFCDFEHASYLIKKIPAADVAPVRYGRWEGCAYSWFLGYDKLGEPMFRDGTVWYCSNQECRRKTVIKEKFCPSCGAKMDLEGEE